MCGIVGFFGLGDQADLAAMTRALTHRGPDGEGVYIDAKAGLYLGHRRLAILDIAGGSQPMWNADRSVGIVFNGEVYNHCELRKLLEARGHVFRTSHSDTEVLVHGYAEWGEKLPARLNGMFAFAIYDRARRRLFLARDRFGEKPLYYYERPGLFAFASELSALRQHRCFSGAIDPRALQRFFAYGYLPAPSALYQGAAKLPGGHLLTVDLATGAARTRCYWRFRIEPDETPRDDAEDRLAEELRHLVAQAAARRLMSDVPLGVFLSGGIDSAAVLASTARHIPARSIKTFTIGFSEPSFDESDAARETAQILTSSHAEERLNLEVAKTLIPQILTRLDEPLGDPSIIPTFLLARFARRQVTVALSGDGGDELFAGYDPFRALAPAHWYQSLVAPALHRGIRTLADLLPVAHRNMSLDFKLRRTLMGLSYPPALWNPVWMAPVEPDAMADLFHAPLHADEIYGDAIALWDEDPRKSVVDRTLEFFTNFYLPNDILAKVDRATMMNSLEARAVFLDNDLVDFARRLPARFKYRKGERKYLLRRAMAPLLGDAILARPKKGFGMPIGAWLRDLAPPSHPLPIAGIDAAAIDSAWAAHRAGRADHRLLLWCWMSLQASLARGESHAAMAA
jgi:asparagine synthase (glutamine-hydrolysing)